MQRARQTLLAAVVALGLVGCANPPVAQQPVVVPQPEKAADKVLSFKASEHADNPLVGHFWSPREQRFLDWKEALQQLPEGGWLMLGENHDHPDHHRLEVFMVSLLAHAGRLGNVALEVVSADQQPAFDAWHGRGNEASGHDLLWDPQRWDWMAYRDLVSLSLNVAPRVLAGDMGVAQREQALQQGAPRGEQSPAHSAFLAGLINHSHCGKLPDAAARRMLPVQLARDQWMAEQMAQHTVPGKVNLLVAGSGHVRSDYAVPQWLPEALPRLSIILQAVGESANPNDYLNDRFAERNPADLVLFVPALPAQDFCAQFEKAPAT